MSEICSSRMHFRNTLFTENESLWQYEAHFSKEVQSISGLLWNQQVYPHSWDRSGCTAGVPQRCGTSSLEAVTFNWPGELSSCYTSTKGSLYAITLDSWLSHTSLVHTNHRHSAESSYCFAIRKINKEPFCVALLKHVNENSYERQLNEVSKAGWGFSKWWFLYSSILEDTVKSHCEILIKSTSCRTRVRENLLFRCSGLHLGRISESTGWIPLGWGRFPEAQ